LDIFTVWQQSLAAAWGDLITRLILFLPLFLSAILVFAVGLLVANWLGALVSKGLRVIRFPGLTQNSGLDRFLKKAGFEQDSAGLLAGAVKWLVVLVFFMTATNVLGLTAISAVINSLISFVPRVVSAILIIAVGAFLANVVEGMVRGTLSTVDHAQAKSLSRFARWIVMVVAIMAGVNELKIAETLVQTFFQGLTWTFTLAVGLAFGLGSKDLVAKMLAEWHNKLNK
jgi:hypothetical protein